MMAVELREIANLWREQGNDTASRVCQTAASIMEGEDRRFDRREEALLEYFYKHPNRYVTSDELLEEALLSAHKAGTLRSYISKLRKKIEEDPQQPQIVLTQKGPAYMLRVEHCDNPLAAMNDLAGRLETKYPLVAFRVRDTAQALEWAFPPDLEVYSLPAIHDMEFLRRVMQIVHPRIPQYLVELNGQPVHLTSMEKKLLSYLIFNWGNYVTSQDLNEHFWDGNGYKLLKAYIARIRSKLGDRKPYEIITSGHGLKSPGYRFNGSDNLTVTDFPQL